MQTKNPDNDHNIKKLNYAINFMNTSKGKNSFVDDFIKKTKGETELIYSRIEAIEVMDKNSTQELYFSELTKSLHAKIATLEESYEAYLQTK